MVFDNLVHAYSMPQKHLDKDPRMLEKEWEHQPFSLGNTNLLVYRTSAIGVGDN